MKVMLVEDNPVSRDMFIELLDSIVDEIVVCETGECALERVTDDFNLIIMDVQLPGIKGTEAAVEIKKQFKIPILALTAQALKGDKERILANGCDFYMVKPIRVKEFLTFVREHGKGR